MNRLDLILPVSIEQRSIDVNLEFNRVGVRLPWHATLKFLNVDIINLLLTLAVVLGLPGRRGFGSSG